MPKEMFIVRNRIILRAAILDCLEVAVHSHPFSKIYPENTGGRVLLLVKFQTAVQSSVYILKSVHQECFLESLPKAFGTPKYHRL